MGVRRLKNYLVYATSILLGLLVIVGFSGRKLLNQYQGVKTASVQGTSIKLAQATCEPPSEGCGSSHYWDFNTCSCVYDGSCVEPVPGCGADYYWDHAACECIPYDSSGSSSCQEPLGGCGTNFEWDNNNCTCVYLGSSSSGSGSGGCSEPTSGCGTDYYWDSTQCSCIYLGTTTYQTCTEPLGGCGAGYYWDSAYCSCRSDTSTTYCTPSTPCGENMYWDYDKCECRSYSSGSGSYNNPTPTPTFSSTTSSTTTTYDSTGEIFETSTFDRLAYESDEIINCIKGKLNSTEYQTFRFKMVENEEDEEYIYTILKEKVLFCWSQNINLTTSNPSEAIGSTKSSFDNEACLIDLIGKDAYGDIYEGRREPTERERLAFKSCYESKTTRTVEYRSDDEDIDGTTQQCLRQALGEDNYLKVVEGNIQPSSTQLKKINACFGIASQPFDEGSTYKAPDKVRSCLQTTLGTSAFNKINTGKRVPTIEERERVRSCFTGINALQKKFLPPPVEEVPFLDEEPELVKVKLADQVKRKIRTKEVGGTIVLSGSGPANSTVSIYIYSDPIVVTTETDENGDWVYELKNPLDGEEHIAYATVRNNEGRVVRSSVFDFTVVAADTDSIQPLLNERESSDAQDKFVKIATLLVAVASVIVIVIGIVVYLKNAKLLKEAEKKANDKSVAGTSKGKGKSDGSSSSIN